MKILHPLLFQLSLGATFLCIAFALFAVCSKGHASNCLRPTLSCPEVAELLQQRAGYGRFATGGLDGEFALVTSNADSGPGTLRDLVENASGPRWIRFESDIQIN